MDLKLRCSASGCDCTNFSAAASKESLRICDSCSHSWITHLLEKLLTSRDDALSVFDVCSLALYGTHALPIRLKIVIERLLATLQPDEIDKILRSFGWTPQDLARGYMIQDPRGGLLSRWSMLPKEEEILILQQFLRFGPTRTLSFSLLREDFPMPHVPSANNQNSLITNSFLPNNSANVNLNVNANLHLHNNSHNNNNNNSNNSSSLLSPKSPMTPTGVRMSSHNMTTMTQLGLSVPTSSSSSSHNNLSSLNLHNSSPSNNHHHNHNDRNNDRDHPVSHSHLNLPPFASANKKGEGNNIDHHDRPALNLSRMHSESDDEDRESSELNMSMPRGNVNFDGVVDLSSTNDIKKTPISGAHNLLGSGGGILNNLSSSLMNNHAQMEKNNSSLGGGRHISRERDHRLRHNNNHQNNLMTNLNNFNKSADLMAAAAAAAAAVTSQHQIINSSPHSHTRKPQQPVKRPWNPLPAPSTLVNPATGKRRVQCSVCLKTFCDKGALKIHFSAVHLREMHKCTVAGCSMMFSSRRSRNRHSANPNPKLHSPHLRRKISPHDGRSCQPLINLNNPMLFPTSQMRFPPFMPGVGISPNGIKSEDNQMNADGGRDDSDDEGMELKHLKLDRDLMDPDGSVSENSFVSSDNEDESYQLKSPPSCVGSSKKDGARKRKLTNPVRLPSVLDDSNDDFCCYDDGTEVSHEDEEIEYGEELNKKVKKAPSSSSHDERDRDFQEPEDKSVNSMNKKSGSMSKSKYALDLDYQQNQTHLNFMASPNSSEPDLNKVKVESTTDAINLSYDGHNEDGIIKDDKYSDKSLKKRRKNGKDLSIIKDEIMDEKINPEKGDEGVDPSEKKLLDEETDHLGRLEALPIFSSPHNSDNSSLTAKSEDEENNGRSGSSPNSNGEIPIDRENPRRCLACSKVFQNHFGVKTHYQNVHLKNGFDHSLQLMHKCTVDGCNAAFPSKRSRDRHSANLNLHRKLLSTSDVSSGSSTDLNSKDRDRGHGHSLSTSGLFNPYLFQNGSSGAGALGLPNQTMSSPMGNAPPWNPFLPYHMFPAVFGTPPPHGQDASSFVDCRFCGESFEEGSPLKAHMQSAHPHEGIRCRGCSSVFFSRKKFESHSKACTV